MGCGRCNERRVQIGVAVRSAVSGDLKTATANITEAARTMREDAGALTRAAGNRLVAAHARLKR